MAQWPVKFDHRSNAPGHDRSNIRGCDGRMFDRSNIQPCESRISDRSPPWTALASTITMCIIFSFTLAVWKYVFKKLIYDNRSQGFR